MSDLTEAEVRLRDALQAAGEAIEDIPYDERIERVNSAFDRLFVDKDQRTFLIGVFIYAHATRLREEALATEIERLKREHFFTNPQIEKLTESRQCEGNIGLYVHRPCGRKTKTTYDGKPLCFQHDPRRSIR